MKLLPVIFYAALLSEPQADQWLRNLQIEQDRIRNTQEQHSAQIAVNSRRLDDLESNGSPNLGKVSERVDLIQGELDRHEAADEAAKEAAERDHMETMHRIDIGASAMFTTTLALLGNMFYGWLKEKRHTSQITAIGERQTTNADEILKVSRDIAVEVRRNNTFESAGAARDKRMDGQDERSAAFDAAGAARDRRMDRQDTRMEAEEER